MDSPHTHHSQMAQLRSVLKQQLAAHQKLLVLIQQKRKLLATADHAQLKSLSSQENEQVQTISELEKERLRLVGELTLIVEPSATAPMRLKELAQRLPEPDRGHLLVLQQRLRQKMEAVRHQTIIAKRATESLVRHMQGLIHTVSSAVTGVGVYSQKGSLPQEAMAVRTFHATA